MNAHVFTTSTSASSAEEVISIPRSRTLPSMISASTKFLAQPRLIMPTFVLIRNFEGRLLDGDVVVVFADRFAVLGDSDCVPVQNADRSEEHTSELQSHSF